MAVTGDWWAFITHTNSRNSSTPLSGLELPSFYDVFVQSNFCCEEHVKYILSVCSQRVYLMKLLRAKGLPPPQLQHICQALIISRILYAVSAWGGFLSAELKNRINGFFRRLYRYGYTPALVMEQLLRDAYSVRPWKMFIVCTIFSRS